MSRATYADYYRRPSQGPLIVLLFFTLLVNASVLVVVVNGGLPEGGNWARLEMPDRGAEASSPSPDENGESQVEAVDTASTPVADTVVDAPPMPAANNPQVPMPGGDQVLSESAAEASILSRQPAGVTPWTRPGDALPVDPPPADPPPEFFGVPTD